MGLQAIFMLLLKYISKYSIYQGVKQPICHHDCSISTDEDLGEADEVFPKIGDEACNVILSRDTVQLSIRL